MTKIDEERCTRKRISYQGENYYLTIGDKRIMAHFPNESAVSDANAKEFINLTCRLISKARGAGVEWSVILKQMRDVNLGYRTFVRAMCDAITEVCG